MERHLAAAQHGQVALGDQQNSHDQTLFDGFVLVTLPNLIVIGAKKSGTTSLYVYLDAHPEISMTRDKELNFFVEERNWSRGLGWYGEQFDAGAPVRGEASPYYTALPHHRGVPERMASVIPDARLVYMVRDPIARLLSHYDMGVARGRE